MVDTAIALTGVVVVVDATVVVDEALVVGEAVVVAPIRRSEASDSEELDPPQADPSSTRINKAFLTGILKVCHPSSRRAVM